MGRKCTGGQRPIPRGQHLRHPLHRLRAATYLDDGPDQITHHVVQKRVASNPKFDLGVILVNLEQINASHGRGGLAFGRTKGAEIMLPNDRMCRLTHPRDIQGANTPDRETVLQRRAHRRAIHPVAVLPANRRVTGMESIGDMAGPAHRNARWEHGV